MRRRDMSYDNGGNCGTPKPDALQARCGFGPRLVLNMVSMGFDNRASRLRHRSSHLMW